MSLANIVIFMRYLLYGDYITNFYTLLSYIRQLFGGNFFLNFCRSLRIVQMFALLENESLSDFYAFLFSM